MAQHLTSIGSVDNVDCLEQAWHRTLLLRAKPSICLFHKYADSVYWKCCYKWNESGFRPPLCTYRLDWARRTSWGWWDDWDDTVLQTQDSKFEPWRSEAEHTTSRSRRLPTILTFTRGWGRNISVSFKPPRPGTEPRTLAWKAAVPTTTLGPPPKCCYKQEGGSDISVKEVYTCFTSEKIQPFGSAMAGRAS